MLVLERWEAEWGWSILIKHRIKKEEQKNKRRLLHDKDPYPSDSEARHNFGWEAKSTGLSQMQLAKCKPGHSNGFVYSHVHTSLPSLTSTGMLHSHSFANRWILTPYGCLSLPKVASFRRRKYHIWSTSSCSSLLIFTSDSPKAPSHEPCPPQCCCRQCHHQPQLSSAPSIPPLPLTLQTTVWRHHLAFLY